MTLVKTFTLRFNPEHMQFDDTVLGEFVREHLVVSMKTEFFYFREEPLWSVMVTYRDQHQPSHLEAGVAQDLTRSTVKKEGRQMLPKPKLDEQQQAVFERIRLWRNEIARAKGHPAGNVLTNRQVREIIELNPKSLKQLTKVHGIGNYKATTYGREILEFLSVLEGYADPMTSNTETKNSTAAEKTSQSAGESKPNAQTRKSTVQTRRKNQHTRTPTVQPVDGTPQTSSPTKDDDHG